MYMERIRKQILQTLIQGEVSVYELIDRQDASLPEFFELVREMQNDGVLSLRNGRVFLTGKGVEICDKLGIRSVELSCKCCGGTGYEISDFFKEVLRKYEEITEERPEAIERYDQGFISTDGVMRRVEFMYERGDLLKSRIFVVGDDDLFSIAAALTGLPKKISVVEIDERLVSFINKKAEEHGLPVEAMVYDVQQAFPEGLKKKFHVFVTDPVETIPGLKLFLSRSVEAIDKGCAGYFGITTLEASRKKWYEIEKMIYEMGFVITDMRRKFNVYPHEDKSFFRFQEKLPIVTKLGVKIDCNWYTSTLFRIEAVKEPKPLVEGEMIIDNKVYKDEESWATPY
jgi:hypothetical protein